MNTPRNPDRDIPRRRGELIDDERDKSPEPTPDDTPDTPPTEPDPVPVKEPPPPEKPGPYIVNS